MIIGGLRWVIINVEFKFLGILPKNEVLSTMGNKCKKYHPRCENITAKSYLTLVDRHYISLSVHGMHVADKGKKTETDLGFTGDMKLSLIHHCTIIVTPFPL